MHLGHSGLHSEFQVSLCYRVNLSQTQTTDRQMNKHYRKLYLLVEICFKGPLQWRFRYKTSWKLYHTKLPSWSMTHWASMWTVLQISQVPTVAQL